MQRKEIQRGDLFYYDFGKREGSVQSGERPVMVIQADNFNANAPTIIVAAVTAVMKKKYLPSHIILGEDFGLKKLSMVLLEQIQTVNKDELTDYIGSVNDERLWKQINAALKKTFGLWIYNTDRNGDVRCLCPKCLSDYIHDPNYVVRRLDLGQRKGVQECQIAVKRRSVTIFLFGVNQTCLLRRRQLIPVLEWENSMK